MKAHIIQIIKTILLLCAISQVTSVSFPVQERERCFQNNDISNQMDDKSTKGLLSKLGMWVLPDRRLCFAGRYIKGVILPDNPAAQKRAIKALVGWYLPCLEFQAYKSTYQINNNCFFKRENELLKVYARLSTLKSHHMQERLKRFLTI